MCSATLRCRPEEWLCLCIGGLPLEVDTPLLLAEFLESRDATVANEQRAPEFHAIVHADHCRRLAWVQAPAGARALRIRLIPPLVNADWELTAHGVAERDPKCHPCANVPRWSTYSPSTKLNGVVLPRELEALERLIPGTDVRIADCPPSRAALGRLVTGKAAVIPREWVLRLDLDIEHMESFARGAWILSDLETLAMLVAHSGAAGTEVATYSAVNEFMSARNEYADTATRGMALMDCLPYGSLNADGKFSVRVLRATREWKRYAASSGFATLLSSQTAWDSRCNDVLSAGRPIGDGELLATDLPWLCAGDLGTPIAPQAAAHLLRMHLGRPIDPWTQYSCRSHEDHIVVRDAADLARRHPVLRTQRWRSDNPRVARLGLTLGRPDAPRALILDSGRMDVREHHDGAAPEPLLILMRGLSREFSQRTAWHERMLADVRITWRFETAAGLRYATLFDAAQDLPAGAQARTILLRRDERAAGSGPMVRWEGHGPVETLRISQRAGLFGDGSFRLQQELSEAVLSRLK
ncbi:MAG: hypothetical protein IPM64_11080 [Phycisphaerales bacterium]|nr:hypothetical protein [Phycisphaerales bacterium]